MKKLLVTGSNGFVGSYFINKYKDRYNIQKFSFLNDDFTLLKLDGIDVVVHLSALVHKMGGASAEEYERANVTQTVALAKKAKSSGVKQFLFMSSVKVYGEESKTKYIQNSECHPKDAYGKSKLRAEEELLKLQSEDFVLSIIRTPIVYGFGVKANIKSLVNLVKKMPVLPFGGIENRRSMVYVGNLCYVVDVLIEQQQKGVFLVSDDEVLSTTKLIELIAKELNKKIYLLKIPFFEQLLQLLKPSFHKRLYKSLEVDSTQTKKRLFGDAQASLPFSVEEGIHFMIRGEKS